jgi:uncharacterized membrane protein
MKNIIKSIILFVIMATVYFLIEFFFRGTTFWQMGLTGGLCGLFIGFINEDIDWDTPLWQQGIIALIIILTIEYAFGMLFNQSFVYWDYRQEFMNLNGMICLKFALLWYPTGLFAVILDDVLRWKLFSEQKPKYKLF